MWPAVMDWFAVLLLTPPGQRGQPVRPATHASGCGSCTSERPARLPRSHPCRKIRARNTCFRSSSNWWRPGVMVARELHAARTGGRRRRPAQLSNRELGLISGISKATAVALRGMPVGGSSQPPLPLRRWPPHRLSWSHMPVCLAAHYIWPTGRVLRGHGIGTSRVIGTSRRYIQSILASRRTSNIHALTLWKSAPKDSEGH